MPNMPDIKIFARSPDDDEITWQGVFPCMVSAEDGKFYASLTSEQWSELEPIMDSIGGEKAWGARKVDLEMHRGRKYLQAKTYDELRNALHSYGRWQVEFTEERTLVIVYKLDIDLHYVKHQITGEIVTNGTRLRDYNANGRWNESTRSRMHGDTNQVYSLGIGAAAYDRVARISRIGATTLTYERPKDPPPAAAALNEFVHVALIDRNRGQERVIGTEVPYTDELAQFLHDAMLQLCKLADGLQGMFATPESLMIMASRGAANLLAPPPPTHDERTDG